MLYSGYTRLQLATRRLGLGLGRRIASRGKRGQRCTTLPGDLNHARVLLLRQNQIGDALISIPVISALKARYPGITIDVLLNRRNATVFDTDNNISRIHTIKLRKFDVLSALRAVRRQRYDVIVDLVHSPSTTSSLFCLLGKARYTVGPERENDYCYSIVVDAVSAARAGSTDDTMMRRFMQVLGAFGIDPDREYATSYFNLDADAISFARDLAAQVRGDDFTARLFALNIAGSKEEKYWGTDRFIELINSLSDRYPHARFLLLYPARDNAKATAIANATCASLSGGTSTLSRFAAAICTADMLISPDSAAVHFADIYRVPVVPLYVAPPGNSNSLWRPSFTPFHAVHGDNGIKSISVAAVLAAVDALADEPVQAERLASAASPTELANNTSDSAHLALTRLAG